jgi:release factor glutamine methyltransferase
MMTASQLNPLLGSLTGRTVVSVLQWGMAQLASHGIDEQRLNVELLLSHALDVRRETLYAMNDRILEVDEVDRFHQLLHRRICHEPVQYIMGEAEFMGISLRVNGHVLIPRPETEILVERTLSVLTSIHKDRIDILDIGTGSGNIPVALAVFAPHVSVTSIDVSAEALATAAVNLSRHNISSVVLVQADLFEEFLPEKQFDVIVSNPPYVSSEEFALLEPEVRDFEPTIATTDGGDGLRFIRRISELGAIKLHPGGWLLMEIAYDQSARVTEMLDTCGFSDIQLWNDYQDVPRIVQARLPHAIGAAR